MNNSQNILRLNVGSVIHQTVGYKRDYLIEISRAITHELNLDNLLARILKLSAEMLAGQEQPLARLVSVVERGSKEVPQIMKSISPYVGKAYRIGITGPPGAGKSTIVDKLTSVMREEWI